MASSTAGGYGTYNPREDQPSAVETALATIVGQNNPAEAANMLDTYQVQRQTNQGNYDYGLAQQHDFAKQQLAQQLYEANLKGLAELKDPTVLQIASSAPQYQQLFGGAGQDAIQAALARSQAAQNATTLEHAGAGAYSAVQAGRPVTDAAAATASGGLLGPQGTPLQMQIEAMKEGAANKRAAIAAAGSGEPNITETIMTPTGQRNISFPGKKFNTPGAVDQWLARNNVPTINAGPMGSAPLPPEAQALAPKPPGTTTSLQPNPAAPAARPTAPPKTPAPNNTAVGVPAYQAAVAAHIEDFKSKSWYADVKAGMAANHGLAIVKPGPGGPALYGASGRQIDPASN